MAAPENKNSHQVESSEQFQSLLSADLQRVSLLYFWAPWAQPCKQMTEVVEELARKYPTLLSLHIEAETHSEISESFEIESVPSFIVLRVRRPLSLIRLRVGVGPASPPQADSPPSPFPRTQGHTLLARITGADARALTEAIAKDLGPAGGSGGSPTATPPLSQTDRVPATGTTSETPEELEE